MHQLLVQPVSHRADAIVFHCGKDSATRLVEMVAIVEPAFAEGRAEFAERSFQLAFAQVVQAEFLKTR